MPRIAILGETNLVELIIEASTLDGAMLNVPSEASIIIEPPLEVVGGSKFNYDPMTETFSAVSEDPSDWASRVKSTWDTKLGL